MRHNLVTILCSNSDRPEPPDMTCQPEHLRPTPFSCAAYEARAHLADRGLAHPRSLPCMAQVVDCTRHDGVGRQCANWSGHSCASPNEPIPVKPQPVTRSSGGGQQHDDDDPIPHGNAAGFWSFGNRDRPCSAPAVEDSHPDRRCGRRRVVSPADAIHGNQDVARRSNYRPMNDGIP